MHAHETALGLSLAAVGLPVAMTTVAVASGVWAALGAVVALVCAWILWAAGDIEVIG